MTNSIGLLGYGYTAKAFAKLLLKRSYLIYGTKRKLVEDKQDSKLKLLSFTNENVLTILNKCSAVLISIAPDTDGRDPVFINFKEKLIDLRDSIKWLGYLSSTGIYGNHNGAWVDEESESIDLDTRNKNRLHVEEQWLSLYERYNIPVHIFRLAGIYGPGRSVIDKLLAGKDYTIVKEGQYFSRIHVDDIAGILYRSLVKPTPGEIFNLCDDHPSPSDEVDHYAAKLLNLDSLRHVNHQEASLSPMAQSFYKNNRRVSNKKMKNLLCYQFNYPSYKEGLQHILNQRKEED